MAKFCSTCGARLPHQKFASPEALEGFHYRSRTAAAVLAFTWGFLGLHKFYLGRPIWGLLYLLLSWTGIPMLVGWIEGTIYVMRDQSWFNVRYNDGISFGQEKAGVVVGMLAALTVILLLGIVAAIALPAYQDYTVRARMSEPLATLAGAKTSVTEYAYANGAWPTDVSQIATFASPTATADVTLGEGLIYVATQRTTGVAGSIYLYADVSEEGTITWACASDDIDPRYLPPKCR